LALRANASLTWFCAATWPTLAPPVTRGAVAGFGG
jgi:hypothetical protein